MKQHELILEQKIFFISDKGRGNDFSISKLAEKYAILKSSVANILIRSAQYQDNYSSNVKRDIKGKLKDESAQHIDEILVKWFTTRCLKHIPISGSRLQEKMPEIVEEMDTLPGEFKALSGWLHKFRNRYMIRFSQISGESVSLITTITDEWKHCLPTIVNG